MCGCVRMFAFCWLYSGPTLPPHHPPHPPHPHRSSPGQLLAGSFDDGGGSDDEGKMKGGNKLSSKAKLAPLTPSHPPYTLCIFTTLTALPTLTPSPSSHPHTFTILTPSPSSHLHYPHTPSIHSVYLHHPHRPPRPHTFTILTPSHLHTGDSSTVKLRSVVESA